MCGIAGVMVLNGGARPLVGAARRMAQSLRHRGPDGEGYCVVGASGIVEPLAGPDTPPGIPSPWAANRGVEEATAEAVTVVLAHRRLAIQDCSPAGHQPMSSADGRYWITYNGEVYNLPEVTGAVREAGVALKGRCDTEVLVNAFALWGPACLDKIHGIFAFAVWDSAARALWLVRDPLGVKPLYYAVAHECLVFASDIKALLASGLSQARVNLEGVYHAFSFGIAPRPLTCFAGVRALAPAHWLRIAPGQPLQPQRYWRIPVGTQQSGMTRADAVRRVHDVLAVAVRRQVRSDVPVGLLLSGGLDSGLIAAAAAQAAPGLRTFTLGLRDADSLADETAAAARVAAHLSLPHDIGWSDPNGVLERVGPMVECFEEPFFSLSATYLIAEAVGSAGLRVALSGLGGDELFGGYQFYRLARWWPVVRALAWPLGQLRTDQLALERLCAMAAVTSVNALHPVLLSRLSERQKQALFGDPGVRDFDTPRYVAAAYAGDVEFRDVTDVLSYMDIVNHIGNHHVHRFDQFTMRFSVEGRLPLLDRDVVAAAFAIPYRLKVGWRHGKMVLRHLARHVLPRDVATAPKSGFRLPMAHWMRGSLRPMVMAMTERAAARGLFRGEEVRRRRTAFLAGRGHYTGVWQIVAFELWHAHFIDGAAVSAA